MAGQAVGVVAGGGDHRQHRTGAGVQCHHGAALVAQGLPGRLLGLRVHGELDRGALPLLTGEDVGDALVEQGIGITGEGVVQRPLDAGEAVDHRVVPGDRGVHRPGIIGAQVAVGVTGLHRRRDRGAVHHDRAAVPTELVVDGPHVAAVGIQAALGHHLEVGSGGEQQQEQQAHHEPHVTQGLVHAITSAGVVGEVPAM